MDLNAKLQVKSTAIPDMLVLEPKVFGDQRGWFSESFNARDFAKATGLKVEFVQDNHSFSKQWTLRGLHYQLQHTQGKLIRVTTGSVFDVAVDLRKNSPTFLQWYAETLSAENCRALLIPEGFAHGFQTLTDDCGLLYLHSAPYVRQVELGIRSNDPALAIPWPLEFSEISTKDAEHPFISEQFKGI